MDVSRHPCANNPIESSYGVGRLRDVPLRHHRLGKREVDRVNDDLSCPSPDILTIVQALGRRQARLQLVKPGLSQPRRARRTHLARSLVMPLACGSAASASLAVPRCSGVVQESGTHPAPIGRTL